MMAVYTHHICILNMPIFLSSSASAELSNIAIYLNSFSTLVFLYRGISKASLLVSCQHPNRGQWKHQSKKKVVKY